jgi:hypothetical protein
MFSDARLATSISARASASFARSRAPGCRARLPSPALRRPASSGCRPRLSRLWMSTICAACSCSARPAPRLLGLLGELRHRRRADAPVLVVGGEQQVAEPRRPGLGLGPRHVDDRGALLRRVGERGLVAVVEAAVILAGVEEPALLDRAAVGTRWSASLLSRSTTTWPASISFCCASMRPRLIGSSNGVGLGLVAMSVSNQAVARGGLHPWFRVDRADLGALQPGDDEVAGRVHEVVVLP